MAIIAIHGLQGVGKDTVGQIIQYLNWKAQIESGKHSSFHYKFEDFKHTGNILQDWKIKKFAGPLKEIAAIMLNVSFEKFEDREYKESTLGEEWWYWRLVASGKEIAYLGNETFDKSDLACTLVKPTVRQFLQTLGTEAIRNNLHPNTWGNVLFSQYKAINLLEVLKSVASLYPSKPSSTLPVPVKYPKWIITDLRFLNEYNRCAELGAFFIKVKSERGVTNNHASDVELEDNLFHAVIENNDSIEGLMYKVQQIMDSEEFNKLISEK